jgi:hypothetical protein
MTCRGRGAERGWRTEGLGSDNRDDSPNGESHSPKVDAVQLHHVALHLREPRRSTLPLLHLEFPPIGPPPPPRWVFPQDVDRLLDSERERYVTDTRKADEYFLHLERRFMMGLRASDHSMRK